MAVRFAPAKRENVKLLLGLGGASGSGKTFSAMRIAKGLAGGKRFAVIDTENGRALFYADQFDFDHAILEPPYRPQAFLDAIYAAAEAGYPIAIVDSASHEYSGRGGLLDWQQEELDRLAGDNQNKRNAMSAGAWTVPKLAHVRFVTDLLQVRMHVILCFRARQAIEMIKEGGKTVIRPTQALDSFDGWLFDTEHRRMPLPFELTCSFLMTPDRPGVPRPIKLPDPLPRLIPVDKPITEQVGVELAKWAAGDAYQLSPEEQKAKALADRALELADQLGTRDQVMAAIAANRRRAGSNLKPHIAWLEKAVDAADQKVGDGEPTEAELAAAGDAATADLPF